MRRSLRTLLAATATTLVLSPLAAVALPAPAASAATTCDRWASQSGSDANAGTQAAPVLSIRALANTLSAGQTGCITNGSTLSWKQDGYLGYGVIAKGGSAGAPITIQPEPGGTASFVGRMEIQSTVSDVVIKGLTVRSEPTDLGKAVLIQVNGDRVTLEGNDLSHPGGICVGAGRKATPVTNPVNDIDYADDLVIRANRIHDCGMSPSLVWTQTDSGAHGVYLTFANRAMVTENLIYRNKWRGLQTWPQVRDTTITNNLFDGNATHVNIGSATPPEDGIWRSERVTVRNNIMTNRVTNWEPAKNPAAIYGNFSATTTPTQYGNVADGNCIDTASAPSTGGYGVSFGTNPIGIPSYTDRGRDDFRLAAGSACVGKGPQSIQPVVTATPAHFVVSVPAAAATTPGSTISTTFTVRNTGGTAGAAYTMLMLGQSVATPGARLVSIAPSAGSCSVTTMQCSLGSIASGATKTVTVTVDVLHTNGFMLDLTAATGPGELGEEAWVSPVVTGQSCTIIGTNAADTLVSVAGKNDVLCGFGGNDTMRPGNGNDYVFGGAGTDTVSYAGQTNPAVVNLTQQSAWDNSTGTSIGWDQFTSVESAIGTSYADQLLGDSNVNVLTGGDGVDQVWGYDGNDSLNGGGGNDKLYGGNGNDSFNGGANTDLCRQDAGTGTKTACETA